MYFCSRNLNQVSINHMTKFTFDCYALFLFVFFKYTNVCYTDDTK